MMMTAMSTSSFWAPKQMVSDLYIHIINTNWTETAEAKAKFKASQDQKEKALEEKRRKLQETQGEAA